MQVNVVPPSVRADRVVVVGSGMAGLVAAVDLAARGLDVQVVERAESPGGKIRRLRVGSRGVDAGPTVLTLRSVFDELFYDAGASLEQALKLEPVEVLARHAWDGGGRLDLYPDVERSADAIGDFAGAADARGYRSFADRARRIYETLAEPFLRSPRPSVAALTRAVGLRRLHELWRIRPFETLWGALGRYFRDPRLRQLFGRYATYVGSSPLHAPATLMLIAHVEREGVWLVDGGMQRLPEALHELAERLGARFRFGTEVSELELRGGRVGGVRLDTGERLEAEHVVLNADVAALASGRLGLAAARAVPADRRPSRSLSALTWTCVAEAQGFPLLRHSVFFSRDYAAEFRDLFTGARLPRAPTVYVCAQDRGATEGEAFAGAERLLCLVNAPATGDTHRFSASEVEACEQEAFGLLGRCGLQLQRAESAVTTPGDFERLFPATGGALYGPVSHGWRSAFRRPGPRSRLAGLYLAGGSAHPGAGLPMAALSGRLAARALLSDLASTARSRSAAMPGGTSMP